MIGLKKFFFRNKAILKRSNFFRNKVIFEIFFKFLKDHQSRIQKAMPYAKLNSLSNEKKNVTCHIEKIHVIFV